MPKRVQLGQGRWADIVDVDDMTHGTKMKVQALLPDQDSTTHFHITQMRMQEMLLAHLITAWSFERSVPGGDPAGLAEVPGTAYDKLLEAAEPHWKSLDFFRTGSTSSDSKTSSEENESPDSPPPAEQ
jgi:hypothetical protein